MGNVEEEDVADEPPQVLALLDSPVEGEEAEVMEVVEQDHPKAEEGIEVADAEPLPDRQYDGPSPEGMEVEAEKEPKVVDQEDAGEVDVNMEHELKKEDLHPTLADLEHEKELEQKLAAVRELQRALSLGQ